MLLLQQIQIPLPEVQANVKQEVKQEVNVDDKGANGKQEVSVKDEVEAETETSAEAIHGYLRV